MALRKHKVHDEVKEGENGETEGLPWSALYVNGWHNTGAHCIFFELMITL